MYVLPPFPYITVSSTYVDRLADAASTITALKSAFNRGEDPIESSTDIHAVCDLVKSFSRGLPDPLFPSADYHLAIDVSIAFGITPSFLTRSLARNAKSRRPTNLHPQCGAGAAATQLRSIEAGV